MAAQRKARPAAAKPADRPAAVQKIVAEIIGTFAVTATAMSVDISYYTTHDADFVSRWLARGFVTAAMIYALAQISGAHLDPAVTLGFALRRVMPLPLAAGYWVGQFAGALAAAALLLAVFGHAAVLGSSHPGPGFSRAEALVCEIVLTFGLMLTILLTAAEEAVVGKQAAVAIGFVVAGFGMTAGPISGASMNPARSLAPQLLGGAYDLMWIYAFGPLVGAALAVPVHGWLCGPPDSGEREAARGP
jgi:aquaporin Z